MTEEIKEALGPQKIVRLTAKNVMCLKAVQIEPDGSVVVIGGNNEQGKSAVLNSIEYVMAGKDSHCAQPVRRGTSKAEIVCELDDLVATRTITKTGGGSLVVTGKNGEIYKRPQDILNALNGKLSFDPLAFKNMKRAQQVAFVKELAGLDFTQQDIQYDRLYTERTRVGRKMKSLQAQLESLPFHAGIGEKESIADLMKKLRARQGQARSALNVRAELKSVVTKVKEKLDLIDLVQRELDDLRKRQGELEGQVFARPVVHTKKLEERIGAAETHNQLVRENEQRQGVEATLQTIEETHEALTVELVRIDDEKRAQLAEAKMPVVGLGFDEEGLTFQELPFEQASSAQQLKVSVAIGLAMNPGLRVLLIRDGSLLDANSLALIKAMADEHDAQVWIERVGLGQECQVIFEDGSVMSLEAIAAAREEAGER